MMVQQLVDDLRNRKAERSRVEVKSAEHGCPKSVRETLSAFANGRGGTIILGLQDGDFEPTQIDADKVRDAVAKMAADDIEPPVRGEIEIETLRDGHRVVVVEVPEADLVDKPVFVKTRGRYGGSYIRSGDGDRRLSHYEIDRLLENRAQPQFDSEPVLEATFDDLDPQLVAQLIDRVTKRQPRVFKALSVEDALRKLRVLTTVNGSVVPTLAGLITLGTYPQQFFPQLFVSVVVLPTETMGETGVFGERFIDNQSCDGPIPVMLTDAVNTVIRNGRQMAVISGAGRTDIPEYPEPVVRELIANAIMHRDYSPLSRGAQIQVEMYPTRLVVRSPGGIYGLVHPEDFGQPDVSSSRNVALSKLLADTATLDGQVIAEHRGSGIPQIINSLHQRGIASPIFEDNIRSLTVTVDQTRIALPKAVGDEELSTRHMQILNLLNNKEPQAIRNLEEASGLSYRMVLTTINDLIDLGLVEPTAPVRSKNRKYILARRR